MTESTCISHMSPLGKNKVGSVGIPLPNIEAAILDSEKEEFVPVGEMGEFAVAGPSVTIGYWKRPDATNECKATLWQGMVAYGIWTHGGGWIFLHLRQKEGSYQI